MGWIIGVCWVWGSGSGWRDSIDWGSFCCRFFVVGFFVVVVVIDVNGQVGGSSKSNRLALSLARAHTAAAALMPATPSAHHIPTRLVRRA